MSVLSDLAEASNQPRERAGLEAVRQTEGNSLLEYQGQGNHQEIEKVSDVQPLCKTETISQASPTDEINGSRRISRELQNGLLIVAILIVTVTYQAGLAPPPSIWKEDMSLDFKCFPKIWSFKLSLRNSTQNCPAFTFYLFMCFNTAGFISALHLIKVAFVGKRKDLAIYLLAISLCCMLFTYATLLMSISLNFLSFIAIVMIAGAISVVLEILFTVRFKILLKHLRRYSRADTASRDSTPLEPPSNHVSTKHV